MQSIHFTYKKETDLPIFSIATVGQSTGKMNLPIHPLSLPVLLLNSPLMFVCFQLVFLCSNCT